MILFLKKNCIVILNDIVFLFIYHTQNSYKSLIFFSKVISKWKKFHKNYKFLVKYAKEIAQKIKYVLKVLLK